MEIDKKDRPAIQSFFLNGSDFFFVLHVVVAPALPEVSS